MSKGQFCVYLSKDQSKQLKSFIYESKIFNKTQLDALFDVLPNNYLEIMMSVLQTTYRRPLDINNSIDKSIIKDYIINKYNELNNKESEDDSSIEYYTTGEVISNEEVESLRDNGAGVFQSFLGNVNNNLISFRRAVFENARKQGIEITNKKDSDFYKFITSLSDSIIRKLMKEGKIITIRPDENLNTNMAVQVNGDVITITYNPLLVVRDADKFDAIISHELLHTVTAAAVNNTQHNIANEEEQQFTQEIFDIIKDLATNENFYWDMNIDINSMRGKYKYIKEFIANVMSNEELREHLSKLKYQQNNNDIAEEEKTSVLTKVFKSIYNYIKSFYSKDTDKELDTTYLEKLTNIIQSHIDTQPSNTFSTLSQYTEGTITSEYEKELQLILLNSPRDKEGRLLAPNGNPTNLTERQYAQVRTKAFKDWFGDWKNDPKNASKVVDENGEPLVVYHGTNADNITTFSLEKAKHNTGIFLSKSKNVARSYVDWLNIDYGKKIINDELDNFNIYESYDEYKNRVLEAEKDADLPFSSLMSEEAFNIRKAAIINFNKHVYNTFVNLRNPLIVDAKKRKWNSILFKGVKNTTESLAVYAKKYGYDGVIVTDVEDNGLKNQNDIISGYEISDEYIVFNPNQIKSATDNVGTFSKTNNRIDPLADILNQIQRDQNQRTKGTSTKSAKVATTFYTKDTPLLNPNTNYVYTENAQVYTKLNDVKGVDREAIFNNDPKMLKLDVTANNNQAGIRAYTKEGKVVVNTNAYGLVTKKFQQNKEGKFIHQEGVFKDTKEDFELFKALNEDVFNRLENSSNKDVVFPTNMAIGKAALPKRFAEWLQNELKARYGLEYTIVENEQKEKNNSVKYSGYGLQITQPQQSKKTTSNKTGLTKEEREKQEKEKQKKEKEAALKSYNAEAPSLHIKIDKSKLDSILINNIPNLAQRVALEKVVYHLFNNYWDFLLQEVRENRETIQDENLAKIYDYILKGSQEEQKLKLLNSLTYVDFVNKNGSLVETKMNPIEYLRNLILKDIINLSMATSYSTKTNSRGEQTKETIVNIDNANAIINYYLVELDQNGNIQYDSNGIPKFKRNTPFGESFYLKYGENNQYLNLDLKSQAVDFIKTLSMQIQPLTNEETFDALFIRSQRLLKHNDNIKISFLNKGSFTNKNEDNLNEPEEEDRSGLNLVRFKTLEPSKRMSQRVRKILSQTPRYLNNKIQFNSLGLVEYLSPDIAYYQLVDKFAAIKNEQDYNNLINSLQEEYPWFKFIKEKLDEDEIFRNDFYSAFRNVFNRFAIINEKGKISYLNGEAAINILIDDLQSTYESGLLLNEYSIYKSNTTPDIININNFRNNVLQGLLKGFSSNFSALKTAKEKNTLTNEIPTQIATLLKQLFILSEYRVKQENSNESIPLFDSTISLKAILNTFGVSTDKLDLSHLYTSFEDIIEYINSREEFKNNPINIEDFLNVILNTQNATETDKVKVLSEYIVDKEGLIEAFIDYFTQPSIESKIKKLSSMLKAMSVIVNSKTGFINVNTNLIQSFYKQYLTILSSLKDTTEIYGTTTFQFGNKPRPSYSAPSYTSDILRHLNTIETQEDLDNFRTWVQQEFTQFDFYKDSKGECNHLWIKTLLDFIGPKGKEKPIKDIKEFARNFDYVEILGIGGSDPENTIGKVGTSELLNSLIPAAFNVSYSSEQSFGYFRNPLYSDKDVLVLFKAPMFRDKDFKDKVINQLYKVWEAEYDRINFYVTRHNFKNKNNSIEGLEKTGDKFHFFPEFNNEDFFNNLPLDDVKREEYVKENLRQLLESKFESFFATTYSDTKAQQIQDIIEGNFRKDKSERIQINFEYEEESLKDDESKESNEEEKKQQQDEVLRSLYEQFYYNDFMNYIESIRLFQGDPALYGNSVALVKRGAQSHVFGQRGYFIDENGNPITERCMYIEDYYADSNSMANVMALLKQDAEIFSDLEKGMIEGLIRKTANYYKDICTTDGQSFRTVDSMKKILKGFGKLTPEIEESLDRIQSGTMNAEDIMKVINNLKPFLYSNESRILKAGGEEQVYERNEKVITQHKNSEYALSALYSILNTALNKSNALKGLQKFMNDNNIDVAHFKSVVKVGANNLFDLNNVYNSELDEILKTNSTYYTYDKKENKIYLELPLKVSKEENEIKIEIPSEMQGESPAEIYKYIRELLKINIEKDISLSQQELNHKQKVYNAFQRQYGLESLPEDEVVSILNSQLHTDEEGNTSDSIPNANKIHIFKLQDYVLVQPVDDHYLDHEAIFGSQLRNIVPANLPDNFTCTLRIKGKEIQLNKEQTIQLYNTLITDQLLDSYNINLRRKFTSIKEFKKYVDNLIAINDKYGEDIQNALQLDESGTDFRIPFTSPNLANKIDEIILSAAKNAIQRQKIKGGNIVLISNFGFTSDLHVATETIEVTDKNGNKTEQKRIKYIPCYAPMSMMQIYKDYLQEEDDGKGNIWYTIDFEKLKKDGNIDHKFLDMIGYRIPSENNYSIMPIRIVGILPQSMGSSIMLPHDIITMSGTDFDIDKLFLMIRAIFTEVGRSSDILDAINKAESDSALQEILNSLSEKEKADLEKKKGQLARKDFPITDIQLDALKKNSFIKVALEKYDATYDVDERKIKVKASKYVLNDKGELDISESSKLSSIKNSEQRKEVRNNMLIDVIEAIITSPYGSGRSQKPGQFDSLKRQSLIHKIVNDSQAFQKYIETHSNSENILESLMNESNKTLKSFYEEYAEVQNPNDILWYVNQHYNLMQGNDLIGGAAVASSNHLKLQNLPNFKLKEPLYVQLPFKYKGKTYYLGQNGINRMRSSITGQTISDLYAEVQAAAPDNGKVPVLGYLGINLNNLYFVNYLIGLGLPIESISQLLIVYKKLDYYVGNFFYNKERYNITQNSYLYNKDNKPDGFDGDIVNATNILLTDPTALSQHSTYIRGFLNMILALDAQAKVLNNISSYSRVDSTNGALPVLSGEAIQQRLKVQRFIKDMKASDFPFQGLNEFIDTSLDPEVQYLDSNGEIKEEFRDILLESPIARMQAMYSLGIKGASTLMSRFLISMNPSVIENLETLAKENGINLLSKRGLTFINNYLKNITTYLMSSNQFIGDSYKDDNTLEDSQKDKANYYIHDFPIKFFNLLPKLKTKYPHLSILRNLIVSKKKGIILQSVTNIVEQTRTKFREELEWMLISEDPELHRVALDLFLYSYYKTGLQYKYNSYGILFSTFFLDMLGDMVPNLKEVTRDFGNYINNQNKEDLERYSFQFLLNNINLLRRFKSKDVATITQGVDAEGNPIHYVKLDKGKDKLLKYEYQGEEGVNALKYIVVTRQIKASNTESSRTVIQLYELTESNADSYLYRPINFNRSIFLGTDAYRPYYNRNLNNIEFNNEIFELKSQGIVMKIEDKKTKKNKKTLNAKDIKVDKKGMPENSENVYVNPKDTSDLYTSTEVPDYITSRTDQEELLENSMSDEEFNKVFSLPKDMDEMSEKEAERISLPEQDNFIINQNETPEQDVEVPKMKEAPEVEDKDNRVCRN